MKDRRLVYSTELGSLRKRAEPKAKDKVSTDGIVRVHRQCKGRGGKTVCVIEGLNWERARMRALLKRLQQQLGTGGALKGQTLEIQGDHRQALLELLRAEGIKAQRGGGW